MERIIKFETKLKNKKIEFGGEFTGLLVFLNENDAKKNELYKVIGRVFSITTIIDIKTNFEKYISELNFINSLSAQDFFEEYRKNKNYILKPIYQDGKIISLYFEKN